MDHLCLRGMALHPLKENRLNNLSTSLFAQLGLPGVLVRNLAAAGMTEPRPIQEQAIPPMLDGRDILGIAQTGSGKTFAFTLPVLARVIAAGDKRRPKTARALVLVPTRELAVQIEESVRLTVRSMHLSIALVLGGVSRFTQVRRMASGIDILIATPGRLMDHVREKTIDLSQTCFWVLDEADRMLDMGFIGDVRRIAGLIAAERQTAFFSATMPKEISHLAESLLRDPVVVKTASHGTTAAEITQYIYSVPMRDKKKVLAGLLGQPDFRSVIVFTRTKYGADAVARYLYKAGYPVGVIHGNKSQNARQRALRGFREGSVQVLVATDIAARGIDVPGVSHVINYELPDEAESYIHRIGRTGRNGASGDAITLYDASVEKARLRGLEKVVRRRLEPQTLPALPEIVFPVKAVAQAVERKHAVKSPEQRRRKRRPVKDRRGKEAGISAHAHWGKVYKTGKNGKKSSRPGRPAVQAG